MDLISLFSNLSPPAGTSGSSPTFAATPIPGYEQHRLAKDEQGNPTLLLAVSNSSRSRSRSIPLSLEHLMVYHNQSCQITNPNGTAEIGQFTVITCKGSSQLLHTYFLNVISPIIEILGTSFSQNDIDQAIENLIELFSALIRPPHKAIQGLWAELYVIARSKDPTILVKSWHATKQDRYDFNAGSQRIEVKSVVGRIRQHHFSLEQLQPPIGTDLLIASIFIERSGKGVSLAELVEQIHSHLNNNPNLALHFDQVVASTLGNGWRDGMRDSFDQQLAEQSLEFYEYNVVPSVGNDLPVEISEVHFKADLTGKHHANYAHYRSLGGLFQSALK
ncbi:MAG: PD-(D/E)XK motif protein [Chloroflexota bacterium]